MTIPLFFGGRIVTRESSIGGFTFVQGELDFQI